MVEIANSAVVGRTSLNRDVAGVRPPAEAASPDGDAFAALTAVAANRWRELAERAVEPNGYYLPGWELAVNAFAKGRTGVSALSAWQRYLVRTPDGTARLIGLMPAISLWRAYRIPLPALANADPYGTLGTPLLDRDAANDAVTALLAQARKVGAHALILRNVALDGAAMKAVTHVLRQAGLRPRVLQSRIRACLDATRDSDALLRDALGAKKLKELRRQRHRLAEHGAVHFEVARTPEDVASAIETFLTLEASGWKGRRGTALVQDDGDASFVRRATIALAEDASMRDRELAGRRYPGRGRDRIAASGSRVLFQARHRRTLCEIFAGRAVDARSDPASLRRSANRDALIPPRTPIIR